MKLIGEGLQFPEGPIALADGRVLVVEIKSGTLATVSARTARSSASPRPAAARTAPRSGPTARSTSATTAASSGTRSTASSPPAPQPADYIGGRIQRVDIDTGRGRGPLHRVRRQPAARPERHRVRRRRAASTSPTSASPAPRDQDKAGVYYATTDGSSITEIVYGLDHANGIALSPDGSRLYVAETITGRVWAWDIASPGVLGAARRVRRPAPCSTASTATSCSTRWPSTATATSAWPRSSPAPSASISPKGELLDQYTVPRARPVRHQRLLRRRRLPHGVRHVVGPRPAVLDGVAARRPRPALRALIHALRVPPAGGIRRDRAGRPERSPSTWSARQRVAGVPGQVGGIPARRRSPSTSQVSSETSVR